MSGQNWNLVLNRVLAVQVAETNLRSARAALNDSINRGALENYQSGCPAEIQFVVGTIEYTVKIPAALLGQASVTVRDLNVITLNK